MAADADLVVIGSGAGGAPVALVAAQAGLRVVLLEKGRDVRREEMIHDEIKMTRRDFFVPDLVDEPHTLRYGDEPTGSRTVEGWTANVMGGGTAHYSGFFFRMKPVDLKLRSTLGAVDGSTLCDWPIAYADLEPYYARAERDIGVSGVWKRHPFEEPRSADYPLPPLPEHGFAGRIDEAGRRLGLHPFPTPRAILSRARPDRAECLPCGSCGSFGCPQGAKGSTAVALLPAARATGRCEVRPRSMATELIHDGERVRGVVYRDADGKNQRVAARCVVLACSAVETVRLLLLSRSARFPSGLANGAGQVGKHFVFSGLTKGAAWFGRSGRAWLDAPQSPFVQRSLQDFYFMDPPVSGVKKGGTLLFSLAHASPIFTAERLANSGEGDAVWGAALKERIRRAAGHVRLEFETFAEFFPNSGTFVDLDPVVRDRFDQPVARMTVRRHPLGVNALDLLRERGLAVLRALDPDDVEVEIRLSETKFLQGGGCRMGADPGDSVVDRDGRAHEVDNLYVADGSVLPTLGGVPPTLTILANAYRIGEGIVRRFREGKL
jgi:choline dehydrogenase-like flavoprotein